MIILGLIGAVCLSSLSCEANPGEAAALECDQVEMGKSCFDRQLSDVFWEAKES